MLIKDELIRKLDKYNGTKLKRMYKLTDQDMVQMYKFFWTRLDIQAMIQGMIQALDTRLFTSYTRAPDDKIVGWLKLVQDAEAKDEVIAEDMDLVGCIQ